MHHLLWNLVFIPRWSGKTPTPSTTALGSAQVEKALASPGSPMNFLEDGKWHGNNSLGPKKLPGFVYMDVSKNSGTQQPWGFPTKNDHFGVVWGYHHFRKHPYTSLKTNILNPTMGGEREDWSSFSTQVIFRFQPLVFRGLYVGSFAELGTSRLLNVIFCWRVFFSIDLWNQAFV